MAAEQQTEPSPAIEQIAPFACNAQSGGDSFGIRASSHSRVMTFAGILSLKRGAEMV
jgi:hypothetical protein